MSDINQSGVETFQRCFPQYSGNFCTLIDKLFLQNLLNFRSKITQDTTHFQMSAEPNIQNFLNGAHGHIDTQKQS